MNDFFTITLLVMLAAISPGPDFAMIVKNSLSYNRMGGIFTAIGISVSLLFHASYCILGLSIIISQSTFIFNFIKYLGAAYLIYIGIKSIFAKKVGTPHISSISILASDNIRAFRQGFLCNILNPKAIMFFVALFTLVLKPSTPVFIQFAYAIEIFLIHLVWFISLSLFLTHHKMLSFLKNGQTNLTRVMGGLFIIFGLRIATLSQ